MFKRFVLLFGLCFVLSSLAASTCHRKPSIPLRVGLVHDSLKAFPSGKNPNFVGHNSRDLIFRNPVGPVPIGTDIVIRIRCLCGALEEAKLMLGNLQTSSEISVPMNLVSELSDGTIDFWETTLDFAFTDPNVYSYYFYVRNSTDAAFYGSKKSTGGWGEIVFDKSEVTPWNITYYRADFTTPEWAQNGVMYQIFPERFRNGNTSNDPSNSTNFFYNSSVYLHNIWNERIWDPAEQGQWYTNTFANQFYGGDLQGVIQSLDYLKDLGVSIIYFNPIFQSPSNHKYDTTNYRSVDMNFGTLETLETLSSMVKARGMKLVFDGVYNHASSDSIYFDYYNRFGKDTGACDNTTSYYRSWFRFKVASDFADVLCAGNATYEGWYPGGYGGTMPRFDSTNRGPREFIWDSNDSIALHWLRLADGWRLDAAEFVDEGVGNNGYWKGFRKAVKRYRNDSLIIGEFWDLAVKWLLGDQWDGSMNYPFSFALLSFWRDTVFVDGNHRSGNNGPLTPLLPGEFIARIQDLQERYPAPAFYSMMNIIGTHDTARTLFMLDHSTWKNDSSIYENPDYDWTDSIQRLKGLSVMQFSLPGIPVIYYGDEVGLVGPPPNTTDGYWGYDPYNRLPYPWLDLSGKPFYKHLQTKEGQQDLLSHYKVLTKTRREHCKALCQGSLDFLTHNNTLKLLVYGRKSADLTDAAIFAIIRSVNGSVVKLALGGYIAAFAQLKNVLDNRTHTVDEEGNLKLNLSGNQAVLLVPTSPLPLPPKPVTDLTGSWVSGRIHLEWTPVDNTSLYTVYRSWFGHGAGYVRVDTIQGAFFEEDSPDRDHAFFYRVIAKDPQTLLSSDPSNAISLKYKAPSLPWVLIIVGSVLGAVILILIVVVAVKYWQMRKRSGYLRIQ